MAIPKFLEDLLIISKLGDNPGADNGLSSSGLREKFDEAGVKIQKYINDTLIPALSGLSNPEEGLNMKNNIAMGGHRVTGLGEPVADGDAVPRGYANGHFAPAVESAEYPGCFYRTVNGVVEWLNPPMVPGVEYRTTERFFYNGVYFPVYTMEIYCGPLPPSGYQVYPFPDAVNNALVITDWSGYIDYWGVSLPSGDPGFNVYPAKGNGGVVMKTDTDRSAYGGVFITLKYIKAT